MVKFGVGLALTIAWASVVAAPLIPHRPEPSPSKLRRCLLTIFSVFCLYLCRPPVRRHLRCIFACRRLRRLSAIRRLCPSPPRCFCPSTNILLETRLKWPQRQRRHRHLRRRHQLKLYQYYQHLAQRPLDHARALAHHRYTTLSSFVSLKLVSCIVKVIHFDSPGKDSLVASRPLRPASPSLGRTQTKTTRSPPPSLFRPPLLSLVQ
jgi:hypothetical protein